MNSLIQDYENDHRGKCRKCCLHCVSSSLFQAKVRKLEKENEMLKKENEKYLEDKLICLKNIGEFDFYENNNLKIKLKELEEREKVLMFELKSKVDKNYSMEKDIVQIEQDKTSIKSGNVVQNELLEAEFKKLSEENNRLKEKLESRTQTIHRFLNEQVKVMKYSDMKVMKRLLRAFQGVKTKIDIYGAEHLNVLQTLQEVQEICGNCRESFQDEKIDCESELNKLKLEQLNDKFLLEQQTNLITTLREEVKKLKEEIKELRRLKKDELCSQETPKVYKEKVQTEILLPPTPDSWSTSQDTMSSEDIGFDTQQSYLPDSQPQISPETLEIKIKSEHVKGVSNEKSTPKKLTQKIPNCFEKDSTNSFKPNMHFTIRNPIKKSNIGKRRRRKNILFQSISLDNGPTDDHGNSNFKEFLSEQELDKGNDPPKEIVPKSKAVESQRREYINGLSLQPQKSLEEPVNECVKMSAVLAGDNNLSSHLPLLDDDKTIIGSEGWSPQYDLESNDFESTLSQLTWFPEMVSPLRQSPVRKSECNDNKDYPSKSWDCSQISAVVDIRILNDETLCENTKKPNSVFSPILKNDNECKTSEPKNRVKNMVTEAHEPGKIFNETKHKTKQKYKKENNILKSGMSMRKIKNCGADQFETKSYGVESFLRKENTQMEDHLVVISESRISKITDYDKEGGDKPPGSLEDEIKLLEINSEQSYKRLNKTKGKLMKGINLSSEINEMPREMLPVERILNRSLEDEFKPGLKNESKFYKSGLGKTIDEDKPLDLSFCSSKDIMSKNHSACDILLKKEIKKIKETYCSLKPDPESFDQPLSEEMKIFEEKSPSTSKLNGVVQSSPVTNINVFSSPVTTNNVQISPVTTFDPSVSASGSQNIESHIAFSCRKAQTKKLLREMRALNKTLSSDGLFISPQSKNTTVTSPLSVRSPTAMDCYDLRLSPKVPENLQYCTESTDKSPKKSPKTTRRPSQTRQIVQSSRKKPNVNNQTSPRSPDSMKHYNMRTELQTRQIVQSSCKSPIVKNQSSPRSPDSMKHYNMRTELHHRNNCSSTSSLGAKTKSAKIIKSKVSPETSVQKPAKFKKSSISPNIAKNNTDILSEIKAQSSIDDLDPLMAKLKLTPQERMNELKDQESLVKPIKINVGSQNVNGMSLIKTGNKTPTTPLHRIHAQIEKHWNNKNDNETTEKVICTSNSLRTSDYIVERDSKPVCSRIIHCTYSRSDNSSTNNDLLKIVDCTTRESVVTETAKLNNPMQRKTEDCFLRKSQEGTNNCIHSFECLSRTPTSKIDLKPVPDTETTVSQKTLFMDIDLSYKVISYRSSLFDSKRKYVQDELDETRRLKRRPELKKDFLKTLNSYQRSHIILQRLSSLGTSKLNNTKKCFSKKLYSKSQNTIKLWKARARSVKDTSPVSEVSERLLKGFNGSCSAHENTKNQVQMLPHQNNDVTTALCPKEIIPTNEFNCSLAPPRDENSKSEEDVDCLVIDVDENSMDSCEDGINDSSNENQTTHVQKFTNKIYPENKLSSKLEVIDNNLININIESRNEKAKTSDPLSASCTVPHFQPLPEAMCKYKENLIKTNTDFSYPENRVLPFLDKNSAKPKAKCESSLNNYFLPKFYIEHEDSLQNNTQTSNLEEICPKEDDSYNINLLNNSALKVKTLDHFIPSGVKTEVTENVLRTVLKKHAQDLPNYKERNTLERRNMDNKVAGDHVEKVVEIIKPLFEEDLKSVTDIFTSVNQLEQYEFRVIVKALMMLLYKKATEAYSGNTKASWMLYWQVPQMANKKSPFVHPRIQSAHVMLVSLISQLTKKMSDEEKQAFLDEELHFIEQTFICSNNEFSDTLPAFWFNLGFVYTLLARQFRYMVRVRQFIYDMLYCYTKRALTVAYAVLIAWPSVLKTKNNTFSSSDPLTLCITHLLTAVPPESRSSFRSRNSYFSSQLREVLKRKFKYPENCINSDQLFDLCFQRLEMFGVHEALVLLAKRQPRDWFTQRPLQQLTGVIEGWWKGGDECTDSRAAAAVNILCTSLRAYNALQIQPEVAKLFTLFQEMLADESTPAWMQEVIILNVCRLARLNLNMSLDVISNWRPSEISQRVIDQILLAVISKRSPHWWSSHRVGRFYLCHR